MYKLEIGMKRAVLVAGLLMSVAGSAVAMQHGQRVVEQTTVLELDDGDDARRVFAWIAAQSPEHAPLHAAGHLTITQTRAAGDGRDLRQSPPPTPLPSSGAPGQIYAVSNTLPDGRHQSWTYQWQGNSSGGGWILRAYELRNPGIAEQEMR